MTLVPSPANSRSSFFTSVIFLLRLVYFLFYRSYSSLLVGTCESFGHGIETREHHQGHTEQLHRFFKLPLAASPGPHPWSELPCVPLRLTFPSGNLIRLSLVFVYDRDYIHPSIQGRCLRIIQNDSFFRLMSKSVIVSSLVFLNSLVPFIELGVGKGSLGASHLAGEVAKCDINDCFYSVLLRTENIFY